MTEEENLQLLEQSLIECIEGKSPANVCRIAQYITQILSELEEERWHFYEFLLQEIGDEPVYKYAIMKYLVEESDKHSRDGENINLYGLYSTKRGKFSRFYPSLQRKSDAFKSYKDIIERISQDNIEELERWLCLEIRRGVLKENEYSKRVEFIANSDDESCWSTAASWCAVGILIGIFAVFWGLSSCQSYSPDQDNGLRGGMCKVIQGFL
jgi:hypothetical protein